MKASAKRLIALLPVLVMVVMPVLGLNLSVSRAAKKVESGYTDHLRIAEQLSVRINGARGLLSLCEPSLPEYQAAQEAVTTLLESDSPHEQYEANEVLEALYPALSDSVPDSESRQNEYYVNLLENAERVIEADPYPQEVAQFEDEVLGALPVRLLRPLLRCSLPENFS